MKIQTIGKSHVGSQRDRNEDAFLIDHDRGLYAVSDGMGGHQGGEVASFLAVDLVEQLFQQLKEEIPHLSQTHEGKQRLLHYIEEVVQQANHLLYTRAKEEPTLRGMGAALTVLLLAGNKAMMGHVGHSRLYLYRQGVLSQLSYDHTVVNELIDAGLITEKEALQHAFRHVLNRALGLHESILVDTLLFDILPGDLLLLCTDGLYRHLGEEDLANLMAQHPWETLPDILVDWAVAHEEEDDITVLVTRIPGTTDIIPDEHGVRYESLILKETEMLQQHYLSSRLPMREMLPLLHATEWISYPDGHTVVPAGAICDSMYFIVSGALRANHAGKILTREQAQSIGERALIYPYPMSTTWTTLGETTLLQLSHTQFQILVRRRPKLGAKLLQRLGAHLCHQISEQID